MLTVMIHATQGDIDRYRRAKWTNPAQYDPGGMCPLAFAASRALRTTVRVGLRGLRVQGRDIPLPPLAQEFVDAVDAGYTVHPISFEVAL